MLVTRHYNRMPEGEMLEILESQNLPDDHNRLALVVDDLPVDFFVAGVKAGWLHANDIAVNGVRFYRVYWQLRGDGAILHIHASLTLDARPTAYSGTAWGCGVDRIAALNGCRKTTFSTSRKGHVFKAQLWGAKVTGVTMEKNYV
jgi:hypothetical protein